MTAMPLRVGLIGLGAVGQAIVELARQHDGAEVDVVAALVRDAARPRPRSHPPALPTVVALLALRPEVVVEAGGHGALRAHGPALLSAGCDLIVVSVGALADAALEGDREVWVC